MGGNDYKPMPEGSDIAIPEDIGALVDYIAQHTHDVWAVGRFAEGYTYGETVDEDQKKNPNLKPYSAMTDEEKLADKNAAEGAIRFLLNRNFSITETSMNYPAAEYRCYDRYYGKKNKPLLKAPLVIGLVGDDCADDGKTHLTAAADRIISGLFDRLEMPAKKQYNSERTTPVYVLSALESPSEKMLAGYLSDKYAIEVIHAVNAGSQSNANVPYAVQTTGDRDEYIIKSSSLLVAMWDGVDKNSRTGRTVRSALLETDQSQPCDGIDAADTVIRRTRPVWQIVLPNAGKREFAWLTRLMLPYTLDSGTDWYTLERAVLAKGGKSEKYLIGDTENSVRSGEVDRECRRDTAAIRAEGKKAVRQAKKEGLPKNRIKALKAKYKKKISRREYRSEYHRAVEKFKKSRFEQNISRLRSVNSSLENILRRADRENAYDLFSGGRTEMHGKNAAADALNLRHLRYDTAATAYQKSHRARAVGIALCAGIGLSAYGVFSDLASSHSLLGVLGGVLSTGFILAALILFGISRRSDHHGAHVDFRLLSEGLRVRAFWAAAQLPDRSAGDYFSERQGIDLEWAQLIFNGWEVIDRAFGLCAAEGEEISLDDIGRVWIGSGDVSSSDAAKYTPTTDGQLEFVRKRGNEFTPKARKQDIWKAVASAVVVLLTLAVTVLAAYNFIAHTAVALPQTWAEVTADRFTGSAAAALFETVIVFIIGVIPSIAACLLMYKESKMYAENAKRYKWMAVKYQKLVFCFEPRKDGTGAMREPTREEKLAVLEQAGRVAIEEIAEWTALTSDSDINLPF